MVKCAFHDISVEVLTKVDDSVFEISTAVRRITLSASLVLFGLLGTSDSKVAHVLSLAL